MEENTILDELDRAGFVVISTKGTSMRPLLRAGHSQVLIEKLNRLPKTNDVVLYQRANGDLILHRVIKFEGNVCLIRGDNTYEIERVPLVSVNGIISKVWCGKLEFESTNLLYNLYVNIWNLIFPIRKFIYNFKQMLKKVIIGLLGDSALAWIAKKARNYFLHIALIAIGTAISSLLSILLTLIMRDAIDFAVSADISAFVHQVGLYLAVVIISIILNAILRQLDESTVSSFENSIKVQIYNSILHSSLKELSAYHTGELQNRMNSDVKIVAYYATELIPDIMATGVQLVLSLIVLFALDWRFTSIFLVGGLAILCITFFLREKMKDLHKKVQESDGRLRSWMQESVENLLILKCFQAEDMATSRTEERSVEYRKSRMQRRTFSNFCNIGYAGVMQSSYLFGFVWCCFGILKGTLTFGTLTAVLQLINQISSPFAYISGFVPQYYSMIASAERLIELEEIPKDVDSYNKSQEFETLCARNLCFGYNRETVLDNVTFEVKQGEIIAITGESGAGKSTLIKLLLGVYSPISGRLYAETSIPNDVNTSDNHSKTIVEINIDASTRGLFSYVPQGNMLMS